MEVVCIEVQVPSLLMLLLNPKDRVLGGWNPSQCGPLQRDKKPPAAESCQFLEINIIMRTCFSLMTLSFPCSQILITILSYIFSKILVAL